MPKEWYRLFLLGAILVIFAAQKFIEVRPVLRIPGLLEIDNTGSTKLALGVIVSVLFFLLLWEFVATRLIRFFVRAFEFLALERWTSDSVRRFDLAALLLAGVFLLGCLCSDRLAAYIQAVPASPPLTVALGWFALWLGAALVIWRIPAGQDPSPRLRYFLGFAGLLIVTRLYAYWFLPFDRIAGDMLQNIDRTLGLLFAGQFPYIDAPPPPMPYWPLTFLLYAPPKLLGCDLRFANLAVELVTVYVALFVGIGRERIRRRVALSQLAVPILLLYPTWTFYSAETQIPVSVLLALLLGRTVVSFSERTQAVVLGAAVAANQTFGVLGLLLLPFWIRRLGLRRALMVGATAFLICLLILAPFLIWDGREFLRVSVLSLEPFTLDQLAGRFTLRPLLNPIPYGAVVLGFLTIAVNAWVSWSRVSDPTRIAAGMALAYCLMLMLLHRTFSHYFLPVLAIVTSIPFLRSPAVQSERRPVDL